MKKLLSRTLASLVIGGAMLYLAARSISFEGTGEALLRANWLTVIPFIVLMAAQHLARTWRWGELLAPVYPLSFRRLLPISSVGYFAIMAFPLRMGELVRPYLIATPPRLTMSHAIGSTAVERVFDGLFLALTASLAIYAAKLSGKPVQQWLVAAGITALLLFVAALVVLVLALWQQQRAVVLCHRLFSLLSPRLAERAARVANDIVDGFQALPNRRHLLLFVLTTAAYWLFNAGSMWVLAIGFGLPLGLWESLALTALIGIGIMIPAGPGFIGNFELFAHGALSLYLPPVLLKQSAAFIIASHALNALWYIATGLLGMFSSHVSFRRVVDVSTHLADEAVRDSDHAPTSEKMDTASHSRHVGLSTQVEPVDVESQPSSGLPT